MTGYVKQDTSAAVPAIGHPPGSGRATTPVLPRAAAPCDTTADMIRMYDEENVILNVKPSRPATGATGQDLHPDRPGHGDRRQEGPAAPRHAPDRIDPELPYSEKARAYTGDVTEARNDHEPRSRPASEPRISPEPSGPAAGRGRRPGRAC